MQIVSLVQAIYMPQEQAAMSGGNAPAYSRIDENHPA
ncbi:hypothetical protein ABID26_006738 [Mesorhizobium shonense]|uniref:Uncharacterized protein n=1 Tax=Mesorhizobium shonense TaxID=1209948 RepID=A0ABV2I3F9_9HYPH